MTRPFRFLAYLLVASALPGLLPGRALAQQPAPAPAPTEPAPRYQILSVDVEGGGDAASESYVVSASGLRTGQTVTLPYDEAFGEAVRRLYQNGLYSDVQVVADRVVGDGVYLLIRVTEEPRLGGYTLEGVSGGERDDLTDELPLLLGRAVRPAEIGASLQRIETYLRDKGFRQATVTVDQQTTDDGRVELTFRADKGERVEVMDVRFEGNEVFSDAALRKRLKNTPERRWWRFWSRETFEEEKFQEDLQNLVAFYNDRGYYGARVVRDTFYVEQRPDGEAGVVVEIEVEEGPQYHVRHIDFEGNTLYTDEQLRTAIGFEQGDVFSRSRLEKNLYYTPEHTDVASLYSDRGYLRFNIRETITEAPGDSLDLFFEISEGEIYEFGEIAIRGNTRTKDHVIRRELRTIPGQTYSRQALERSVRELITLNYFDQASLGSGPDVRVSEEDKTVDLTYNLVEAGSDQLELSGGWGGSTGLLLQARVTFNNFSIQNLFNGSAWSPLPMGDGQQLSLGVTTNGRRYQNYSLSFTEPWFRGHRTPVGFSLGYLYYDYSGKVSSASARLFYRQSLRWPDDFFQTGTDVGYRLYDIEGEGSVTTRGLPDGLSQEMTITQSLTRNSLDNPIFPTAGSNLGLSVTVAPPLPGFIQYYKLNLTNAWYAPVAGRLSLSARTRFGYIGSLTDEDVQFQRYLVGGSPLETQGRFVGFGKDLVYLRGYPILAISPIQNGEAVGGRILNTYSAELQLLAIQTPQFSFAPYLFADAANTWNNLDDYNPGQLYRSAGLGARIFLPILGLLDLNYGYAFDEFVSPDTGNIVGPQWRFQFSLGGGQ